MYLTAVTINSDRFPVRDVYPFNITTFARSGAVGIPTPVTLFVGENGAGKSALLEAIARKSGLLPWGGTKAHRGHANPYETQLANHISLEFKPRHRYGFHFRAEAFFNFASSLDDVLRDDPGRSKYFGGGSLNMRSHGESFLAVFTSYSFGLDGLYLLDEPEAALSPASQVKFVRAILDSVRQGGKQYIIATHSPIIMACPGATILSFERDRIRPTLYDESGHYRFYRDFLDDPQRYFTTPST